MQAASSINRYLGYHPTYTIEPGRGQWKIVDEGSIVMAGSIPELEQCCEASLLREIAEDFGLSARAFELASMFARMQSWEAYT